MSKINVIKIKGDIFQTKCDAIVNAVNCQGVMPGGIAKVFADKFPEMLKDYRVACMQHKVNIGECHFYKLTDINIVSFSEDILVPKRQNWKYIINCPTMVMPGSLADPTDVMHSLIDLIWMSSNKRISTIAMPYLGCGVGGITLEYFEKILNSVIKIFEDKIDMTNENMSILLVEYQKTE